MSGDIAWYEERHVRRHVCLHEHMSVIGGVFVMEACLVISRDMTRAYEETCLVVSRGVE